MAPKAKPSLNDEGKTELPPASGASSHDELVNELIQAFGLSRAEVEARLAALKEKFGWTTVPADEVLRIFMERAGEDVIRNVIAVAAKAVAQLLNTGKSEIGPPDPSALA